MLKSLIFRLLPAVLAVGASVAHAAISVTTPTPVAVSSQGGQVTITGAGFPSNLQVVMEGRVQPIQQVSATQVTFSAPAHAVGTVNAVLLGLPSALRIPLAYAAPASMLATSRYFVRQGETFTVTGSGFGAGTLVKVGTTQATAQVVSPTAIQVTVPAGLTGEQDVTVTLPSGYAFSKVKALRVMSAEQYPCYQNSYCIVKDQVFANRYGTSLLYDIYFPADFDTRSATMSGIVAYHGGGWIGGDKESMAMTANRLASQGFVVVVPTYRFAPTYPHPAQVEDAEDAYAYVAAQTANFKITPQQLGVLGRSSGAHLALMLGLHLNGSKMPKCVAAWFPPTDLTVLKGTAAQNYVDSLLGAGYSTTVASNASPYMRMAKKDTTQFVLFHGDADTLIPIDQSRKFNTKAIGLGMISQLYEYPGQGHGFDAPQAEDSLVKAGQFFQSCLTAK